MTTMLECPPTERQMAVLRLIYETAREEGYQPSAREVMAHFGFRSPRAVTIHLLALRRRGYVGGPTNRARAVEFLLRPDGSQFAGFRDRTPLGPEVNYLTAKQRRVFRMIYDGARCGGYQPSYVEIMAELGLRSQNGVHCYLNLLERAGMVRVVRRRERGVEILRRPDGASFSGFTDREATPCD